MIVLLTVLICFSKKVESICADLILAPTPQCLTFVSWPECLVCQMSVVPNFRYRRNSKRSWTITFSAYLWNIKFMLLKPQSCWLDDFSNEPDLTCSNWSTTDWSLNRETPLTALSNVVVLKVLLTGNNFGRLRCSPASLMSVESQASPRWTSCWMSWSLNQNLTSPLCDSLSKIIINSG